MQQHALLGLQAKQMKASLNAFDFGFAEKHSASKKKDMARAETDGKKAEDT